jgi:hypothetical protein
LECSFMMMVDYLGLSRTLGIKLPQQWQGPDTRRRASRVNRPARLRAPDRGCVWGTCIVLSSWVSTRLNLPAVGKTAPYQINIPHTSRRARKLYNNVVSDKPAKPFRSPTRS